MRSVLVLLFAVLGSDQTVAAQQVIGIAIVEYGIYTAQVDTRPSGANDQMKSGQISKICHVETTTTIPAKNNLHFGFRFRVEGPVPGETVEITRAVRWPDHIKPPGAPLTYASRFDTRPYRVGQVSYAGWINWHTMPGTWIFQLLHVDRKLAEMVFTVIPDNGSEIKPEGDSTCFLMSALSNERFERVAGR